MVDSGRRVCVLGEPRLVWSDGDRIVGGPAGRALVSLIVHDGGRSVDELIESVWSGRPPKTARSALHVHLGSLRRCFEEVPPGLALERLGDRYVVRRLGWDLDVELVEAHAAAGRRLLTAGDAPGAVSELERALGLWRGDAFVVGGREVSVVDAHRMQLRRLAIEELLVEALIASDDLERAELMGIRLVEAEPYRELRWGQLVRSLAQQGRARDALTTFERARQRLADDLGVAPGEELQRVAHAVLTRSPMPSRDASIETDDTGDLPVPFSALVDREQLLDRVESSLARLVPVVLTGAPGTGKTRLAIEVARHATSSGRPVRWVDLRNAGFESSTRALAIESWARRHAGGLVVVDNAERVVDRVVDAIAAGRRVAPSVQVLVTSRVPLAEPFVTINVQPLAVPAHDDPDAVERAGSVRMLRDLLALLAPDVVLDHAAAAELCRRLGGLPLAIRLAADLARSLPSRELAGAALARLGPDLREGVEASLELVGADAGDAFGALSVVAGEIDAALAAALVGGDDPHATISQLVDLGLIQFHPGRSAPYAMPEPLRDVGDALLDERGRSATLERLTEECLTRARPLTLPPATAPTGRRLEDQLLLELPWYRQCLDHLAAIGDDARALELVAALDLSLYSLGWWDTNTELQDQALAIPGPPSPLRSQVHAIRGRPGQFHQFDEWHNQRALEIAIEVDAPACRARAEYHLGVIRWWERRFDEALTLLAAGRERAEQVGDLFLVGECTRFTGMALVTAGEADRGLAVQLELVELVERIPELELLLPHLYMHLGHSRRHVGDLEAALSDLSRARSGFEELGNRASLIHVCAGLAEVHADLGRHDEALEAAGRALGVSAGTPVTVYDPWTLCTTARVHLALGDHDLARAAAARALEALRTTWVGETRRVASELAWVAAGFESWRACLRLAGLVSVTDERRELPFVSPYERRRLDEAVEAARQATGADADELIAAGQNSAITEAAAQLIDDR